MLAPEQEQCRQCRQLRLAMRVSEPPTTVLPEQEEKWKGQPSTLRQGTVNFTEGITQYNTLQELRRKLDSLLLPIR